MWRFFSMSALFLLAVSGVCAQTASRASSSNGRIVWEPPAWTFLEKHPRATVSKEMVAAFRISDLRISLEKTEMQDVASRLGGTLAGKGDAGLSDEWLCFYGNDPDGRWVLWLESGEIDGGTVGRFQWQRLNKNAILDKRGQSLGGAKVELPIPLRLGVTEAEVLKTLGKPSARTADRFIYLHEHQSSIQGEPYTSDNVVAILFRAGRAWAIEVSKTTSS